MLSTFVDSAGVWYFLFGAVALGFGVHWWLYRRPKSLIGVAVGIGGILLVWLLGRIIVTDKGQIATNIWAMADAVASKKKDVLLKHFSDKLVVQGLGPKQLADSAMRQVQAWNIDYIHIWGIQFEEVDRDKKAAKAFFRFRVDEKGGGQLFLGAARTWFALEGENWKLTNVEVYNAIVNQDVPIQIPGR